ncbi:MAG TPA: glycosyltransferase [Terriglobia bacterium]|nr:glycosyltransferase [Terriglobia bacterium]
MVPRVKVLKFVTAFAVGGTERQFVHLTRGLDRARFDIQIGCFHRSGPLLNEISALDIPISEYPTTSFYSYEAVRAQLRLAQAIRREGVRLVHAYGSYPNLFTVPAARLARNCVSIASLRDLGLFSGGNKIKHAAQKLAFSFADCVLANSNAARNWLLNQGVKAERVHVIPNGINVSRFTPRPDDCDFPIRREFHIDVKAPLVTLVCRTDRNKGLEGFMEAVPIVADRFPDVRFMIVGGSPCNPCYEIDIRNLAARRNLTNRLIFTGERSDIPAVLQESTLSVLPSLSESFSNSLLESMAAGLPVVATNVGGNPEIVQDGETGFLVPPRDPAAMAAAIIRVLEAPEMAKRFGAAGRERVMKHFSLETVIRRTSDLYMMLLERRGFVRKHVHDLQVI